MKMEWKEKIVTIYFSDDENEFSFFQGRGIQEWQQPKLPKE